MAQHSIWRRLTRRLQKRHSYFENQHALRAAVNLDIPLSKTRRQDGPPAPSGDQAAIQQHASEKLQKP